MQVRRLNLLGQDVHFIEKEDDRGIGKPGWVDGSVEKGQTLLHAVLQHRRNKERNINSTISEEVKISDQNMF